MRAGAAAGLGGDEVPGAVGAGQSRAVRAAGGAARPAARVGAPDGAAVRRLARRQRRAAPGHRRAPAALSGAGREAGACRGARRSTGRSSASNACCAISGCWPRSAAACARRCGSGRPICRGPAVLRYAWQEAQAGFAAVLEWWWRAAMLDLDTRRAIFQLKTRGLGLRRDRAGARDLAQLRAGGAGTGQRRRCRRSNAAEQTAGPISIRCGRCTRTAKATACGCGKRPRSRASPSPTRR